VTTGHLDLHALLGDPSAASIIPAVLRARLRRGRLLLGEPSCVIEWPHFFVEPVEQLRAWRDQIDARSAGRDIIVELPVTSDDPSPRALSFPPRIFADVLQGIAIELADAVRRGTA
jgi:hypothetical protein